MKHLRTLACIADVARSGSIRKTSERLNITPSALTRRIQDFEEELGMPVFDRTAQGMRLNAAGELLVQHARDQVADLDRVRAQIADLSGLRRGHIALVCSQAFVDTVIPDEVGAFRARFPNVSFLVQVRDHAQATAALVSHDAELALILQPPQIPEVQTLFTSKRPVCAIMDSRHPLAGAGSVRSSRRSGPASRCRAGWRGAWGVYPSGTGVIIRSGLANRSSRSRHIACFGGTCCADCNTA